MMKPWKFLGKPYISESLSINGKIICTFIHLWKPEVSLGRGCETVLRAGPED